MKDKIMNLKLLKWICNLKICRAAASNRYLSKFCNYEVISYLVCGVLTTIVNYIAYFCSRVFTDSILIAQCTSWITAVLFAYIVNKIFVFLSTDWSSATLRKELIPFFSCRIFSFAAETVFMLITVDLLSLNEPLMKIVASIFVLVINYIGSKLLVFKNHSEQNID